MAPAPPTPRILVFACNWCSYAAADLAGTTRLEMPADFTLLRVMCTGRVDPVHLLRALSLGADGVLVSGCHPGDCHYASGNIHAKRRVDFVRAALGQLGLGQRVRMVHISAAEGRRFQEVMTSFAAEIRALGPTPLGHRPGHRIDPCSDPGPESRKRDTLRQLLSGMVEELGVALPEGAFVAPALIPKGYGEPRYDPERCTGCGACYRACPAGNIELADAGGERTLSHFHSRCVGCRSCETACPEEALVVEPRFDLAAFLSGRRRLAVQLELRSCALCGAVVAPERQLERAAQRMADSADGGLRTEEPLTCEACRRAAHARALTVMNHGTSPARNA